MATPNSSKVTAWIAENQGKHFCQCGCNKPIFIQKHHLYHGIPTVIRGHLGCMKFGGRLKAQAWIKENQGKFICKCGCGKPFQLDRRHWRDGVADYLQGHTPRPPVYRNSEGDFWGMAKKDKSGCWLWVGSFDDKGYGRFCYKGKKLLAHRLSYFFTNGEWPKNNACHKCNTPACVNPDHIYDGTQKQNCQDAIRSDRQGKKFSNDQVRLVWQALQDDVPYKEVAALIGASIVWVSAVARGLIRNDVTGLPCRRKTKNG